MVPQHIKIIFNLVIELGGFALCCPGFFGMVIVAPWMQETFDLPTGLNIVNVTESSALMRRFPRYRASPVISLFTRCMVLQAIGEDGRIRFLPPSCSTTSPDLSIFADRQHENQACREFRPHRLLGPNATCGSTLHTLPFTVM